MANSPFAEYTTRSKVVEAFQFQGFPVPGFDPPWHQGGKKGGILNVPNRRGEKTWCYEGEWVIKIREGAYQIMSDDLFRDTYAVPTE